MNRELKDPYQKHKTINCNDLTWMCITKTQTLFCASLLLCLVVILWVQFQPQSTYAQVTFFTSTGEYQFACEIASDDFSRKQGLLGRNGIENDKGMVFVYENAEIREFHMRSMNFPLDIIFIDQEFLVINVFEANISDEHILSYRPAQYVVEINRGLCHEMGIESGVKVTIQGI